ncbi:spermatogenesis-associated protein 32 isoform X1 [Cavia porcellus]|uniref:spermatogenesis-associated protein 32 isoform X1 n=1 Tax=Cavia porcellus TaxID=10141 RepID=UPI002FE302C0
MGRTGGGGGVFPCCGKEAVEILEPHDFHPQGAQEESKTKQETELLAEEPDLDSVPELESLEREPSPHSGPVPAPESELESLERQSLPHPAPIPAPEPKLIEDQGWKVTTVVLCHESSRQPVAPRHQHVREEAPVTPRSCYTQTPKHLFWADKLVQTSEHSLPTAANKQNNQDSTKSTRHLRPVSEKQPKAPSTCPTLTATNPSTPPGPPPPPGPPTLPGPLLQAIELIEVVHFGTALAVASSSTMDLPSLGHKISAASQEAVEPSPMPVQPTFDKEELLEKLPKARGQEDKNQPCSYQDFSNQELSCATIKGEVTLLQTGAMSPQLQRANQDSVPGTKKENPLLLKIHFKMSSSPTPGK